MGKLKKDQNGFGTLEALLILIITSIVGGAGWYILMSSNKINSSNTSAVNGSSSTVGKSTTKKVVTPPTPTPKTPLPADPTSDWQTVVNPDKNWVSVKIPKDWVYIVCDGGTYIGTSHLKTSVGICNSGAVSELGFSYSDSKEAGAPLTKASDDKTFSDQEVTVNGIKGHKYTNIKMTGSDVMFSGYTFVRYIFSSKGRVYTASYSQTDKGPDNMKITDQIVGTWLF